MTKAKQIAPMAIMKMMHLFIKSARIFTLVMLGGAFAFGQQ